MCLKGNNCGMKLETGSLVFGIVASVINAAAFLFFIVYITGFNVANSCSEYRNYGQAGVNVGLAFGLMKSAIAFTFSVLLCIGVNEKKTAYVKAYFIYGVVVVVLLSLAAVGVVISLGNLIIGAMATAVIGVYALILHMINLTHQKMLAGEVYGAGGHRPLYNADC
ncbi:uncharacterized protein LOC135078175 [Ostrinia nubilalis]|uniref:uncharacterized protein LOC135078175 n=1 Tax=Ostrinia nubilalis TaxID=29057 RepID=UPI00308256B0